MNIAILGASRGFGRALSDQLIRELPDSSQFLLASRKISSSSVSNVTTLNVDFTRPFDQERIISSLAEFKADKIFYVAGGGPYGLFSDKAVKDHLWALQLNLLFPLEVLHWALNRGQAAPQQLIFVGSAIAEDRPDPRAASYAAAKHGLRGLITSVQGELGLPESQDAEVRTGVRSIDLRLFSPGYIDTSMLTPLSKPRVENLAIAAPQELAEKFWQWAKDPTNKNTNWSIS